MIYVLDTSVFIELTWHYPEDVMPGLWDRLDQMLRAGNVLIPRAVFNEYRHEATEAWLVARKDLVREPDSKVGECMAKLAAELPGFIDAQRTGEAADPWLVAHAMSENLRATEEVYTGVAGAVCEENARKDPQGPLKVPDACAHYRIDCMRLLDMLRREGIKLH